MYSIEIDTGKTRIIERNDRHDHEIILKNFDSNTAHKLLAVLNIIMIKYKR